jgi:hypothetical protein
MLHFKGKIALHKINPYILISKRRAGALKPGWRKPLPVLIKINGKPDMPWRINMIPVGNGQFHLYLHGSVRKASGTKVGDTVDVEVAFDDAYKSGPIDPMPDWFGVPLLKSIKAKKNWDALAPSRQKEILRYISSLKSDEARERNVKKALDVLSGGEGRFMARSWKDGS